MPRSAAPLAPAQGPVADVRLGQGAGARPLPQEREKASVALEAATWKEPRRERTPRVDQAELLRRTFAVEVFACVRCGRQGRPVSLP